MGRICCYANCGSSRRKNPGYSQHKFPHFDKELCRRWIINSGNPDLLKVKPKQLSEKIICQKHFLLEDYFGNKRLKCNAVPIPYQEDSNTSFTKEYTTKSAPAFLTHQNESQTNIHIVFKTKGWRTQNGYISCTECQTSLDFGNFLHHQLKNHLKNFIYRCSECDVDLRSLQAVTKHTSAHTVNNIEIFLRSFNEDGWKNGESSENEEEEPEEFDSDNNSQKGQNGEIRRNYFVKQQEEEHSSETVRDFDALPVNEALMSVQVELVEEDAENISTEKEQNLFSSRTDSSCHNKPKNNRAHTERSCVRLKMNDKKDRISKLSKALACNKCGQVFTVQKELDIHYWSCNTFNCPTCNESLQNFTQTEIHFANVHGRKLGKCLFCISVMDSELLRSHHESAHRDQMRECNFCGELFASRTVLQNHILVRHLKKRIEVPKETLCSYCGKSVRNGRAFRLHLVKHTSETFHPCDRCDLHFSSSETLQTHQQEDHKITPLQLFCKICLLPFKTHSSRKVHYKNAHPDDFDKCETCNKIFLVKEHFEAHKEEAQCSAFRVCNVCHKKISRVNYNRHIQSHKTRFTCPHCPKTFSQKGTLKDHLNLHSGNCPYKCTQCTKEFPTWFSRKSHEESVHSAQCQIDRSCLMCKESFHSLRELRQHLLSTHGVTTEGSDQTGSNVNVTKSDGWFYCSECEYRAKTKSNVISHMRIHKKDRPRHQCEICGKSFLHLINLQAHIGVHNGVKYPCPGCAKIFTTKKNLWQHTNNYCAALREKKNALSQNT